MGLFSSAKAAVKKGVKSISSGANKIAKPAAIGMGLTRGPIAGAATLLGGRALQGLGDIGKRTLTTAGIGAIGGALAGGAGAGIAQAGALVGRQYEDMQNMNRRVGQAAAGARYDAQNAILGMKARKKKEVEEMAIAAKRRQFMGRGTLLGGSILGALDTPGMGGLAGAGKTMLGS